MHFALEIHLFTLFRILIEIMQLLSINFALFQEFIDKKRIQRRYCLRLCTYVPMCLSVCMLNSYSPIIKSCNYKFHRYIVNYFEVFILLTNQLQLINVGWAKKKQIFYRFMRIVESFYEDIVLWSSSFIFFFLLIKLNDSMNEA